jgi:hypothetical protein
MRVLVAGRNAKVLATAAGTFSHDLTIETASTKAACIALLERIEFDLIVACETLGDGSGLEVLSHAAVNTPNALRIFAARPSTLQILKGELGLFGLFRTLPYPINFRKLWAAINLARSCLAETEPDPQAQTQARTSPVQNVVIESGWQTGEPAGEVRQRGTTQVQRIANTAVASGGAVLSAPRSSAAANGGAVRNAPRNSAAANGGAVRSAPRSSAAANGGAVRNAPRSSAAVNPGARGSATNSAAAHVAPPSQQAQDPRRTAQARPAPARTNTAAQRTANTPAAMPARTGAPVTANGGTAQIRPVQIRPTHVRPAQARTNATPQRTANTAAASVRTTAAIQATPRSRPTTPGTASPRDARIPQSEAFKRALAKRNAAKLEPNTHISAAEVLGAAQPSGPNGDRGGRRREPAMSNDSLAQLARLATTRRPLYESRSGPGGKKRAAIFVGSGVFAAVTAAVLTFFMLNANNSIGHTSLPLVGSVGRPTQQKVFAWEAAAHQEPASPPPIRSEAPAATVDDLEVMAEAASDASAVEPGHPGPPQPNPPPGPSEPPTADSPGWVDE